MLNVFKVDQKVNIATSMTSLWSLQFRITYSIATAATKGNNKDTKVKCNLDVVIESLLLTLSRGLSTG